MSLPGWTLISTVVGSAIGVNLGAFGCSAKWHQTQQRLRRKAPRFVPDFIKDTLLRTRIPFLSRARLVAYEAAALMSKRFNKNHIANAVDLHSTLRLAFAFVRDLACMHAFML